MVFALLATLGGSVQGGASASPLSKLFVMNSHGGPAPGAHEAGAPTGAWAYSPHWRNLTPGLPAAPPLLGGTMVYDSHDGYVVWYGGYSPTGIRHETWAFSGGAWSNVTATAGVPPAASTREAMCDDRVDGYVLLFGGGSTGPSAQTWKFANGTWTSLTAVVTGAPVARVDAGMTYDAADQKVLLFGGWDGSAFRNDTYSYRAGAWSLISPSVAPSARAHPGLAFDSLDNATVMVGGGNGSGALNDTWSFSAGKWGAVPAASAPTGLGSTSVSAAPGGGVAGFGGVGCAFGYFGVCNDSFEYYSGAWHPLGSDGGPGVRTAIALTYDARDGEILGFGGVRYGRPLNDTWSLGGPVTATFSLRPPVVEEGDTSVAVAVTAGGYGVYSYSYGGLPPDCPAGTGRWFNCTSEAPGVYSPNSTVTDGGGNVTRPTTSFVVLARLASLLNITPSVTDMGRPVVLQVGVSGGSTPTNFSWSGLPAGCPSNYTGRIVCSPAAPGFFAIIVKVTDRLGHFTLTPAASLQVNAIPSAIITANSTSGIAPFAVQFTPTIVGGTAPFTFRWSFGDGTSSSLVRPSHVYAAQGNYTVSLNVTDARAVNATAVVATPIVAVAPLLATLRVLPGPTVAPATIQFSVTPTGGVGPYRAVWSFGDGWAAAGLAVQHTFGSAGVFAIVVAVVDSSRQTVVLVTNVTVSASTPAPPSGLTRFAEVVSDPIVAGAVGALALAAALWVARRIRRGRRLPLERARAGPPVERNDSTGGARPPG